MDVVFRELDRGLIKDDLRNMYPSLYHGHSGGESRFTAVSSTLFGIVVEGTVNLKAEDGSTFSLKPGYYFSNPGECVLSGPGKVAVFERVGYRGLFQIGGPVEANGRLCYIDNCRSTILVAPPRTGDPVLNLLTFPPHIEQTMHIHPTIRMGVVLSGKGHCILGPNDKRPLTTGTAFYLGEAVPHCFHSGSEPLIVIAYHPDSDVGPTDSSHPMLSRTYTKF